MLLLGSAESGSLAASIRSHAVARRSRRGRSAAHPAPGRLPGRRAAAVGRGSTPPDRRLSLDDVRRRLLRSPPGAERGLARARERLGGGARAARGDRRRDARAVHQAAGDDVDPQGRDRVPGRQAAIPASTPTCGPRRCARRARRSGSTPAWSRSWPGSSGVATAASRFTITPFVGFLGGPRRPRAESGRGRAGARGAALGAARRLALPRGALGRIPARHVGVLLRAGRRDACGERPRVS